MHSLEVSSEYSSWLKTQSILASEEWFKVSITDIQWLIAKSFVSSCQTKGTFAHPLSRDWPEGETSTSHWKVFIMKIILQCNNILWIWQHFGCFIKTIFLFYQQMVWISSRRCKFLLHHFGIFIFCCRHYPSRCSKCTCFNIWMHVTQNQVITCTTWFQLKKKTKQQPTNHIWTSQTEISTLSFSEPVYEEIILYKYGNN